MNKIKYRIAKKSDVKNVTLCRKAFSKTCVLLAESGEMNQGNIITALVDFTVEALINITKSSDEDILDYIKNVAKIIRERSKTDE